MLPEINVINNLQKINNNYTYNINRDTNRISGFINDREALIQACYLILQTERYESLIYNWYYGVELDSLIGKSRDFVNSELKRRIKEALLEDDRITDIININIVYEEDKALIEFTVVSNIGNVNINWEVNI